MKSVMSIIFMGAAAMIFFMWTQPILGEIKLLNEKQQTLNSALSNFTEFQKQEKEILEKYNATSKEDLAKIDKFLPSMANATDLVVEVESMTRNNGLILKDIDVKNPEENQKSTFEEKKTGTGSISVSMKVAGPYKSFISFLGNLEKNLRLIEIERITFLAGDADSYEYNVAAVTYWKK